MKLHEKRYQWMYDKCNEMKRLLVTLDYLRQHREICAGSEAFTKTNDKIHHLAFSFLMVIMGEHIPKSLWTVNDYSELYTIIDENKDNLDLMDDN